MTCVAIVISSGVRCTYSRVDQSDRCKIHTEYVKRNGPHKTELNELKAIYNNDLRIIPGNEITARTEKYNYDKTALKLKHLDYVREHGDPDKIAKDAADARKTLRQREYVIRAEEQRIIANQRHLNFIRLDEVFRDDALDPFIAQLNIGRNNNLENVNRDIKTFSNDNQNVHTTIVVQQTKNIINEILKIKVPEEYRWNKDIVSKTVGEVISGCKLSINATSTMMNRYTMDESTYDLFEGVYGKVLDCIWQFILNHADKQCLIKILKTELEDSRGMCSQGTLARLTNVLAGYVDYIKKDESPAEIMGKLLSGISDITDNKIKAERITFALVESKMPADDWKNWIDGEEFTIQNNVVIAL